MNPKIQDLIDKGWRITSDGPSGVRLEAPKKMTMREGFTIAVGVVLIPFFGIGLLVIGAAIIDHLKRTPETLFIFRE